MPWCRVKWKETIYKDKNKQTMLTNKQQKDKKENVHKNKQRWKMRTK